MASPKTVRLVRPTVLIVGEGDAEVWLLKRIRGLYTNQGSGCKLVVRNAHGKGAQNVIESAIRHAKAADYDLVAALFDTDTDWTATARKRAKEHRIVPLQSEPCLEAWLLKVSGQEREGSSREHKQRFFEHFGFTADDERAFQHFSRVAFDVARKQVGVLDQLLNLIGT